MLCQNCSKNLAAAETIAQDFDRGPRDVTNMHSWASDQEIWPPPQMPHSRSKVHKKIHASTQALSSHVHLQGTGSMQDLRTRLCSGLR